MERGNNVQTIKSRDLAGVPALSRSEARAEQSRVFAQCERTSSSSSSSYHHRHLVLVLHSFQCNKQVFFIIFTLCKLYTLSIVSMSSDPPGLPLGEPIPPTDGGPASPTPTWPFGLHKTTPVAGLGGAFSSLRSLCSMAMAWAVFHQHQCPLSCGPGHRPVLLLPIQPPVHHCGRPLLRPASRGPRIPPPYRL